VTDPVARLLIATVVVALALMVAAIATRFRKPMHPSVVVNELGDRPGVVLFTSTECSTCKKAIARLKEAGLAFREVTYELESHQFESWEVVAVPLAVVVDGSGTATTVFSGVPSVRALRAAAARAGIEQ
jgi:glutaredoxin